MRPPLLQTLSAKVAEVRENKLIVRLNTKEYHKTTAHVPLIKSLQSDLGYCGFGRNRHQPVDESDADSEEYLEQVKHDEIELSRHTTSSDVPKYSTVIKTIPSASVDQYKNLKIFHRHLTAGWCSEIKLCNINESEFAFLATYPAYGLVYFYYNVSPAYIMVQDLSAASQCGESQAMTIMQAVEVSMNKFFSGAEFLENPVRGRSFEEFVKKPRMWRTSRIWSARMPLMLPENSASLTIRKAKECEIYRTLVQMAHVTSKRKVTSASRETLDLSPENSNQIAFLECEVLNLKDTVRSLGEKLCESESKLHKKDVSVKSIDTQTSENEKKIQINTLQNMSLGLEEELKKFSQKFEEAESSWKEMKAYYEEKLVSLTKKNEDAENRAKAFKGKLENREEYLNKILNDFGCALVERDTLAREMESRKTANPSTKRTCSVSCQTSQIPFSQTMYSPRCEDTQGAEGTTKDEQLRLSGRAGEGYPETNRAVTTIQQSKEESNGQEKISLTRIPTTAVERSLYNNYKMLVLTIARVLLSNDVAQLKAWVFSKFSIDGESLNVDEIFLELDRKEVISAFDLRKVREFFEGILKIEVVYMIDCFLVGDYLPLRNASYYGVSKKNNCRGNGHPSAVPSRIGTIVSRNGSRVAPLATIPKHRPRSLVTKPQVTKVDESCAVRRDSPGKASSLPGTCRKEETRTTQQDVHVSLVKDEHPSNNGSRGQVSNSATALTRPQSEVDWGSNGKKLSKFQRPSSPGNRNTSVQGYADDDSLDDHSQWLCNHYKRRCYVRFDCCNKYWPCHRCHNNESKCGETKLKSRDAVFLKCVKCSTEQPFGANSQCCSNCHLKFSKYFCDVCKHLTGTDDNPYHCRKCGICRIHGDRSFHCDVCGVSFDVQLRGNHKCRAGSAHDQCCICLEDAFTGCQRLPCSHKVHKECATRMIRSGITRCPICRESFAHKLERRNFPPSKKNK